MTTAQHSMAPHRIPGELRQAVDATVAILQRFSPALIEAPRVEANPEDDGGWWVAVPVWFRGSLDQVASLDEAIMKEFAAAVPVAERERIVIDLRIE